MNDAARGPNRSSARERQQRLSGDGAWQRPWLIFGETQSQLLFRRHEMERWCRGVLMDTQASSVQRDLQCQSRSATFIKWVRGYTAMAPRTWAVSAARFAARIAPVAMQAPFASSDTDVRVKRPPTGKARQCNAGNTNF